MTTDAPMPDASQPPATPPPMQGSGQYNPPPNLPPQQHPKAPVVAMWVCLILAWIFFIIPIPGTVILAGPLNLAALILAILCLARSATLHGVLGLIGAIVVSAIIYILGWTLMAAGAVALADAGYQARSEEVRAEVAAATNVLAITDTEMLAAYQSDRRAAERRFEGKIVEVTGTVSEYSGNRSSVQPIYMFGDGTPSDANLRFYFASKDDIGNVSQGDKVTIRGKCDRSVIDIRIYGCRVIR